jgi:hypothetical protein
MATMIGNSVLARMAGAMGIGGQVVAAYVFLLIPGLTVPSPQNYLFFLAWAVLLGLAIAWWWRHPWHSFLVPVARDDRSGSRSVPQALPRRGRPRPRSSPA